MVNSFNYKNAAILTGWILGLLFFISLIWILTQPLQAHYILRSVNGIFINSGDTRRLASYMESDRAKSGLIGYWFNMYQSEDKMFVFGVFRDGILIPFGAIVSDTGRVSELIPLSTHAEQVSAGLSESFLQVYINRIETAVRGNTRWRHRGR